MSPGAQGKPPLKMENSPDSAHYFFRRGPKFIRKENKTKMSYMVYCSGSHTFRHDYPFSTVRRNHYPTPENVQNRLAVTMIYFVSVLATSIRKNPFYQISPTESQEVVVQNHSPNTGRYVLSYLV